MANKRGFKVRNFSSNGLTIGGVSTLSIAMSTEVVVGAADGAAGPQEIDVASFPTDITLTTSDVTKAAAFLNTAPTGACTFYTKNSVDDKYTLHTLGSLGVRWHSFSMPFGPDADGTLTLQGKLIWATADNSPDDMWTLDSTIVLGSVPTLVEATRLYRPNSCSLHVDPGTTFGHISSFNMSLSGNLLLGNNDSDFGETSVDIGSWGALTFDVTGHEAFEVATDTNPAAKAVATSQAGRKDFTIAFRGRGGGAAQTLTIHEPVLMDPVENHSEGYTETTVNGQTPWKDTAGGDGALVSGADYVMFAFAT